MGRFSCVSGGLAGVEGGSAEKKRGSAPLLPSLDLCHRREERGEHEGGGHPAQKPWADLASESERAREVGLPPTRSVSGNCARPEGSNRAGRRCTHRCS